MSYTQDYRILNKYFNNNENEIRIPELNIRIFNIPYHATSYYCLPGIDNCTISRELSESDSKSKNQTHFSNPALNEIFNLPDMLSAENNIFKYILLKDTSDGKSGEMILLFHGLNEKSWAKYLSWALSLHKMTGKAVMLFPISFHMNRCPDAWSNRRLMNDAANERRAFYPGLSESSFANAAISTRLTLKPQRFFYSGFQTYYDLMKLLGEIRNGKNPLIKEGANIDIFSYSIGAFLSEVLFFSGSDGLLNNARLCMFCGGTTADKFRPVVKTIMDSAAYEKFHNFYSVNYEKEIENNLIMKEFYRNPLPEALAFQSLLSKDMLKEFRECKLSESAHKIYAIPLEQDLVIPSAAVSETLKGEMGNIPIRVEPADFPYRYTHESPFPINELISSLVDECYEKLFFKIAEFLS